MSDGQWRVLTIMAVIIGMQLGFPSGSLHPILQQYNSGHFDSKSLVQSSGYGMVVIIGLLLLLWLADSQPGLATTLVVLFLVASIVHLQADITTTIKGITS